MTAMMVELDETTMATVAGGAGAVYEDQAYSDDGGYWGTDEQGNPKYFPVSYFPVSGTSAGIASWYLVNGLWYYGTR